MSAPYQPTAAQIDLYQWHRDVCIANSTGQSTFKHRLPEGTLTQNPTTGSRNKRWTQPATVRDAANQKTVDTLVWCVWRPQELKVGAHDAGDSPALYAWMLRALGQMPAIDDFGNLVPIQDEDWMVDPFGQFYRCENPVPTPDGAMWTFEMWSQR